MPQLLSPQFCLEKLTSDVREAVEKTLGVVPELVVGWPTLSRHEGEDLGAKLLSVEVALAPQPSEAKLILGLEYPLALSLMERTLGRKGHGGPPHAAARLNDAEQGVLLFLLTKLARGLGKGRILGMRSQTPDFGDLDAVLWSSRVELGRVRSAFHVWLATSNGTLSPASQTLPLRLCFADEACGQALSGLNRGDLLIADGAPLTSSQGDVRGLLSASLDGVTEEICVRIEGTKITRDKRARSPIPPDRHTRFEIWHAPIAILDAARVFAGESLDLGASPHAVKLGPKDAVFAAGELVRYRGKLAVRIDEVYECSSREDGAPH